MKRKLLAVGLLLAFVVGGMWWGARGLGRAASASGRSEAVDRGDVAVKVTETGTIEPLKKVEVKSKVAGRVARLTVQEGSRVRAGQLLVEIDPTEINSQVEQMRAQLEGANARYRSAARGVGYQAEQTRAAIRQAREALRAAEARLAVAREEYAAQPARTRSDESQAGASLQVALDSLALLKSATHPQALVQARSGYDEAQVGADNAERSLARNQKLLAKGFVSEQVVDTARAELAAARSRRDQAEKRLDLIGEQNRLDIAAAESRVAQARAALERSRADRSAVPIRRQEVVSAQSAVEQARAQLRAALSGTEQDRMRQDSVAEARAAVVQLENQLREVEVRQRDTRLVAPMDGVVTRRYVEEGELVTSGVNSFSAGTPILQIADLSRMLITMSVNEVDVYRIRPGLPVEITVDGARGDLFAGRVRKVAPAALGSGGAGGTGGMGEQRSSSGGTRGGGVIRFAVEVLVDRPDPRLRPGMSARCTIVIDRRKNVLRVPGSCVEGSGNKATVQVVTATTKDGKTINTHTPRAVTTGLRGDSHTEIVSGLRQGERVKPGAYTGPARKEIGLEF